MTRLLVAVALLATTLCAQGDVADALAGHWSGALMRDRTALVVTLTIESGESGWTATPRVPLWWRASFGTRPISMADDGTLRVGLPYGEGVLRLDADRRALVGRVTADDGRVFDVHLERVLRPPPARHTLDEVSIAGPAGTLAATVVRPRGVERPPTLVWVHGRGCWDGARRSFVGRAELLAEHGVASVAYDKRGTGGSDGRCDVATLDDLAADALAVLDHARAELGLPAERVGLIGTSAGGWTSWRATELAETPPAFVVTMVGPATSVAQQQRDNMALICDEFELGDDARADALRYVDALFDRARPDAEVHAELTRLLGRARDEGWIAFHEDTDIAATVDDVPRLWGRRHAYDPAEAIAAWRGPVLALYGGADRVVPAEPNAALFERLATDASPARVRVVPGADHGMWVGETELDGVTLPPRVAHGVLEDVLDLLADLGWIAP